MGSGVLVYETLIFCVPAMHKSVLAAALALALWSAGFSIQMKQGIKILELLHPAGSSSFFVNKILSVVLC